MRTTRFIAAALLSLSVLPVAAFAGNTNVDASTPTGAVEGTKVEQSVKVEKDAKVEQVAKVEKSTKMHHVAKAHHAKAEHEAAKTGAAPEVEKDGAAK